ncbi:nucleoside recognition domain-containing protein [Paenibacillus agricola]|uniref:Sporulation protein n=1 Tax=Paenibacillus agricola TaxID=2716264 RepID=A0ABX0IX81_9BACL|nr:nucleoside recognition domain-containing protein [Paenibacillus agricola]NHN28427.1 sporulation protein [Paenibacillus agricola]
MFTMTKLTTLLIGGAALLLVICMIVYPERVFQASLQGLSIWWKLVFPALLPFLIITEIMRGMGILHGLGKLLEPLLHAVFRLPGAGGWPLALGFTSGAPSGAIVIAELRRDKLVTREEAERLLSLTHVTSPMVLITVIGVGFLQNAAIGLALALLHYGAALIMGLLQRGIRRRLSAAEEKEAEENLEANRLAASTGQPAQAGWIASSLAAIHAARAADGRTFGKLLGESVTTSIQQLMAIGGLIMIFSVLIQVLSISPITTYAAILLNMLGLTTLADAQALLSVLLPGVFEIHLGAFAFVQQQILPEAWHYALLSAIFAWGGLSAHAQVKSFIRDTDIRYFAFLRSRLQHAMISFVLTYLLWGPLKLWLNEVASPVFLPQAARNSSYEPLVTSWNGINLWPLMSPVMMIFGGIVLIMLLVSIFTVFIWQHRGRDV